MTNSKYIVFLKTVELQSLSKAAEALNYTQSNVTQMIQSMEKDYGFRLLNRNKGGVSLTENGKFVFESIRNIVYWEERLYQTISMISNLQAGTLRIGSFSSVCVEWLPEIVAQFQQKYPGIQAELMIGDYNELVEWLNAGRIDCGFVTSYMKHTPHFFPLVKDEMLALASVSSHYKDSLSYDIQNFGTDSFVYPYKGLDADVNYVLKHAKVSPNVKYRVKGDEAIIALVEENLGVGMLPELYLRRFGNILKLPLNPRQFRTIGLSLSPQSVDLPLVQCFMAWVKEWLQSHYNEVLF